MASKRFLPAGRGLGGRMPCLRVGRTGIPSGPSTPPSLFFGMAIGLLLMIMVVHQTGAQLAPDLVRPGEVSWTLEAVDAPATFDYLGPRSLALDGSDHPHIAYGGNFLYHAWFDGEQWQRETVDHSVGVGFFASIAIDRDGFPHISYNDEWNGDLKYAYRDGSGWHVQTVDSTNLTGESTSIALDSAGHPHISYCSYWQETDCYQLRYAHWTGTQWEIEVVTNPAATHGIWLGIVTSLALDAAGQPRILFQEAPDPESPTRLKYAERSASGWQIATIDEDAYASLRASLVLDGSGQPHVSYYDQAHFQLKYATRDGAAWSIQVVDSGQNADSSLALDSAGRPVIAYSNLGLKYAYWTGSAWELQTVDTAGASVGRYASLAIDSHDRAHISYVQRDPWNVKYAHCTDSGWNVQFVDSLDMAGAGNSLALDSQDRPHISYWDMNDGLIYASKVGTDWLREVVEAVPIEGSSLAIDPDGASGIAYADGSSGALKYAHREAGQWRTAIVDAQGRLRSTRALAFDHLGRPQIAYTRRDDGRLMYARWTGSAWSIQEVAAAGENASLALDRSGMPHVAYTDSIDTMSGNLVYAYWTGSEWRSEVVAGHGGTPSLALNSRDRPSIVFGTPVFGGLKFARQTGAGWEIQTVDPEGDVGHLVLDRSGRPVIGYGSWANFQQYDQDLKYARWTPQGWTIQVIDAPGNVGFDNDMALDSRDLPRISYADMTDQILKYASGESLKQPR